MHLSHALLPALLSAAQAAVLPQPQQQTPLQTPQDAPAQGFHIPTVHESAIMARRIVQLEGSASLGTVFPSSHQSHHPVDTIHTTENRPSDVANMPLTMPEYIANCEPLKPGHPTILQVDIASTFLNTQAGSNITLSVQWHPPNRAEGEYSMAMMPRVALVGWLQEMELSEKEGSEIKACWMKKHPETVWTPNGDIHVSRWVRFMPEEFYWFGGFGDRARIQWIGMDEWFGVREEEVEKMRLPGEPGGGPVWPEWVHRGDEL